MSRRGERREKRRGEVGVSFYEMDKSPNRVGSLVVAMGYSVKLHGGPVMVCDQSVDLMVHAI